ncbi:MAG: hypothetical protein ACOYYS_24625 [Chloroflexota bacterium]
MGQSDPSSLDAVYAYVERAYLRMQAGDVLMRCLDEGSTAPIQQVVEGLVLAGPQSITVLREILAESSQRKSQVQDDMHQVYVQFASGLDGYGVSLKGYRTALSLIRLTPRRFLGLLRKQSVMEDAAQVACLQLLHETRLLLKHLAVQFHLLEDVEQYLEDWMLGVVYDAARSSEVAGKNASDSGKLH